MRQILLIILLLSPSLSVALAAEAPVQDYKQLYFQEQAMRGQVIEEMGKLIKQNAILTQQLDQLRAEFEKAQAKKNEQPKK